MKISLKWLEGFFSSPFELEPQVIAQKLTQAGLEVEEGGKQEFEEYVLVGQIVELQKHPQADRLTLCQVDVGKKNLLSIVCGAKNHRKQDKVIVALEGACLPGDFKIKKTKIRGEISYGMLCSQKELGLDGEKEEGIWILDSKTPVGAKLFEVLKKTQDRCFDMNVTPNRSDCLSHYGLARELSSLLGKPLKPIKDIKLSGKVKERISVKVKQVQLCPRYTGRSISGVQIKRSPEWLQKKLKTVGLKSINNVVDITNYVMFDRGQPLHAFDSDLIDKNLIQVELAERKERFRTLFGDELCCDGSELVIRDGKKIVALAGIIGGENSGVTESTKNIFLESAFFNLETVRKTSRKYGLETDSSYRFTRGVDCEGVLLALNLATQMILDIAGGETTKEALDVYPQPAKPQSFKVSLNGILQRLSYDISAFEFEKLMKSLNCKCKKLKNDHYEITPPLYRQDLQLEEDVLEECARLKGYDRIPETLPSMSHPPQKTENSFVLKKELKEIFSRQGCLEAVNYHFTNKSFQDDLLKEGYEGEEILIENPLNEHFNVMRKSLLPHLFKNMLYNIRYGNHKGRLFEVGTVFQGLEKEKSHLGCSFWGQKDNLWSKESERQVIYDLKTVFENWFLTWNPKFFKLKEFQKGLPPCLIHPYQALEVFFKGNPIGFLGTLHPSLKQKYKIKESVALAEVELVMEEEELSSLKRKQFQTVSKFPSVNRDLSFVVGRKVSALEIQNEIKKQAGRLLKSIEIFDSYPLENSLLSLSFRMVFQDEKGTLSEEQLSLLQENLISSVSKKLNISIRK